MKQYKLKWAYFEPLYSVFLNTQKSSKVMFKKNPANIIYPKKIMHSEFAWKKIHARCLWPPPPPPPPNLMVHPQHRTIPPMGSGIGLFMHERGFVGLGLQPRLITGPGDFCLRPLQDGGRLLELRHCSAWDSWSYLQKFHEKNRS